MADLEKSLGAQPPTPDNMPSKMAHRKPSSEGADETEQTENEPIKEKAGGFKDFLVSVKDKHHL